MAKIRAIHPGFWNDTTLAECSQSARLFYIGLWNFADDAGVFEWHERLLRSQVFPFDENVDVRGLLDELLQHGRLVKFSSNGKDYGLILNFPKYQKPDSRYLRYLIGPYEQVQSLCHAGVASSTRGEPSTEGEGEGEGDSEVKASRVEDDSDETKANECKFIEVAVAEKWCDRSYVEKTVAQAALLSAENQTEFHRKLRVLLNCLKSKADGPKKLAKKMFHEVAGFVNDFGAMERVLTPEQVTKRRGFAGER